MSRVKERDEQEALKLDEHFKQTLTLIRPYILKLRSVEEAHLCRIWLDKLNSTILQRNLRNEYLLELSRQLKAGTLEGIFKTQPPNDLLMPLPSSCHAVYISSSLSEFESNYGRNHQKCLTLNEELDQRTYLRNKINVHNSNSSICTNVNRHYYNDNTMERKHLKLCKHRVDMLISAFENLQIQNKRLKQELIKCREKVADSKTFRLRNRIKQLRTRTQTQGLAWKVRVLKKTIAKLRQLNNTIEHVYEKKLQHIIRNKNLEIKVLQLQFQGQTSELCLSLCSEKHNELQNVVGSLEEKYRALLAAADASIESQRQEYFTKIAVLEAELCHLRNNLGAKPK